jgi:4-carboxymuconolactone decarboxylase
MAFDREAVTRLIETEEKLRESSFGNFGRFNEIPLLEMSDTEKAAHHLVMEARGLVPGPYRIWVQNLELTEAMLPMGLHYQRQSTLSKAEIEIAVNLTNGKLAAAYSSYEHEWMAEVLGGLSAEKVQALITGLPTSFDAPRQQVIYELTSTLLQPRIVPTGLFKRAVELLGHAGLTDLIAFIGYFTTVSLTLRAYDVPANAVGLRQ